MISFLLVIMHLVLSKILSIVDSYCIKILTTIAVLQFAVEILIAARGYSRERFMKCLC